MTGKNSSKNHTCWLKIIAVILINAFLCLDAAWAAGGDIKNIINSSLETSNLAPTLQFHTASRIQEFDFLQKLITAHHNYRDGKTEAACLLAGAQFFQLEIENIGTRFCHFLENEIPRQLVSYADNIYSLPDDTRVMIITQEQADELAGKHHVKNAQQIGARSGNTTGLARVRQIVMSILKNFSLFMERHFYKNKENIPEEQKPVMQGKETSTQEEDQIHHIYGGDNKTDNFFARSKNAQVHLIIDHSRNEIKAASPSGNSGCLFTIQSDEAAPVIARPKKDRIQTFFEQETAQNGVVFDTIIEPGEVTLNFEMGTLRYLRELEAGTTARESWTRDFINRMQALPLAVKKSFENRGFSFADFCAWARLSIKGTDGDGVLAEISEEGNAPVFTRRIEVSKKTSDGKNANRIILEFPQGVYITRSNERTVRIIGREGKISVRVKMSSDFTPLTPLSCEEILNNRGMQYWQQLISQADANVQNPDNAVTSTYTQFRRAIKCLEFLSYREKIVAGSWRYLSYFGRDVIISMMLLKPYIKDDVYELAMQSVLDRMSEDGKIAHEEHVGSQAVQIQLGEIKDILDGITQQPNRIMESRIDEIMHIFSQMGETIYDYKMLDTDMLFMMMVASYLADPEIDAEKKRKFLEGRNMERIFTCINNILNKTNHYTENPTVDNLLKVVNTDSGLSVSWQDSKAPYGREGEIIGEVNSILVPEALKAARMIMEISEDMFGRGDLTARVRKLHTGSSSNMLEYYYLERKFVHAEEIWQGADTYFKNHINIQTMRKQIAQWLDTLPDNEKQYFLNLSLQGITLQQFIYEGKVPLILSDGISFNALSLDPDGQSHEVMTVDEGFSLLYGNRRPEDVIEALKVLCLPFPYGLFIDDMGFVVCNPIFSHEAQKLLEIYTNDDYHGFKVVWLWTIAAVLDGLKKQLVRCLDNESEYPHEYIELLCQAYIVIRDNAQRLVQGHGAAEVVTFDIVENKPQARIYKKGNIYQLWSTILPFLLADSEIEEIKKRLGLDAVTYEGFMITLTKLSEQYRGESPVMTQPVDKDMALRQALAELLARKNAQQAAIICIDAGASRTSIAALRVDSGGNITGEVLGEPLHIDTSSIIGDKDTFYNNLARNIREVQRNIEETNPDTAILPLVSIAQLGKFQDGRLVTDIGTWKIGPGFSDIIPEKELYDRLEGIVITDNDAIGQFLYSLNTISRARLREVAEIKRLYGQLEGMDLKDKESVLAQFSHGLNTIAGKVHTEIAESKVGYLDIGTSLGGGFIEKVPQGKATKADTVTDGHVSDIKIAEGNVEFEFPYDGEKLQAELTPLHSHRHEVWATDIASRNAAELVARSIDRTLIEQGKEPIFLPMLSEYGTGKFLQMSLDRQQELLANLDSDNLASLINAQLLINIMENSRTDEAGLRAKEATEWLFGFVGENLAKVILKIYLGEIEKMRPATLWTEEDIAAVKGTAIYIIGGELGYHPAVSGIILDAANKYLEEKLPTVSFKLIAPDYDPLIGAKGAGEFVTKGHIYRAVQKANGDLEKEARALGYNYPPQLMELFKYVKRTYQRSMRGVPEENMPDKDKLEQLWAIFEAAKQRFNIQEPCGNIVYAIWFRLLRETVFARHAYACNVLWDIESDMQAPNNNNMLTIEHIKELCAMYRSEAHEADIWQAIAGKIDYTPQTAAQKILKWLSTAKKITDFWKKLSKNTKILLALFGVTAALSVVGVNIKDLYLGNMPIDQIMHYVTAFANVIKDAATFYAGITLLAATLTQLDKLARGYKSLSLSLLQQAYGNFLPDRKILDDAAARVDFVSPFKILKILRQETGSWFKALRLTTRRFRQNPSDMAQSQTTKISNFNMLAMLGHIRDTMHELLIQAAYKPRGPHAGLTGVERREQSGKIKYNWLMNAMTDWLGREAFNKNRLLAFFGKIIFMSTLDDSHYFWYLSKIMDDIFAGFEESFGRERARSIIVDAYFNGYFEKGTRNNISFVEAMDVVFGEGTFMRIDRLMDEKQYLEAHCILQREIFTRRIALLYEKLSNELDKFSYDEEKVLALLDELKSIVDRNNDEIFDKGIAGQIDTVLACLYAKDGVRIRKKIVEIEHENKKMLMDKKVKVKLQLHQLLLKNPGYVIAFGAVLIIAVVSTKSLIVLIGGVASFGLVYKIGQICIKGLKIALKFITEAVLGIFERIGAYLGPKVALLLDKFIKLGTHFSFTTKKFTAFESIVKLPNRLPRLVRLQRVWPQGAQEELLTKGRLGAILNQAISEGKECYVRQISMSGKPTFIAIIGQHTDKAKFRESVREIILDARIYGRALDNDIVIDISGQDNPLVYTGNEAVPCEELGNAVYELIYSQDKKIDKMVKENRLLQRQWRINYHIAVVHMRDFQRIARTDDIVYTCKIHDSEQYIAVIGNRQGEELIKYLVTKKAGTIRHLEDVIVDIRGKDILIYYRLPEDSQMRLASEKAAEELKAYVQGFMKYYLVSDLHLGDLSSADDFGPAKEQHFIKWLEQIIEEDATLVINGDFLELWQAKFGHIRQRYTKLFNKLREVRKIVYITGNHDGAVLNSSELFQAVQSLLPNAEIAGNWVDYDLGIILEHGHAADNFNSNSLIGVTITKIVGLCERYLSPRIDDVLGDILYRFVPMSKAIEAEVINYLERQLALLEMYNYYSESAKGGRSFVLGFGHTHDLIEPYSGPQNSLLKAFFDKFAGEGAQEAAMIMLDFFHYFNTGTWSGYRLRWSQDRQAWKNKRDAELIDVPIHRKWKREMATGEYVSREDTVMLENYPNRKMYFKNGTREIVDLDDAAEQEVGQEFFETDALMPQSEHVMAQAEAFVEQSI